MTQHQSEISMRLRHCPYSQHGAVVTVVSHAQQSHVDSTASGKNNGAELAPIEFVPGFVYRHNFTTTTPTKAFRIPTSVPANARINSSNANVSIIIGQVPYNMERDHLSELLLANVPGGWGLRALRPQYRKGSGKRQTKGLWFAEVVQEALPAFLALHHCVMLDEKSAAVFQPRAAPFVHAWCRLRDQHAQLNGMRCPQKLLHPMTVEVQRSQLLANLGRAFPDFGISSCPIAECG